MDHSLVYPMFAMVLLTFGALLMLLRARVQVVQSGSIDPKYFETYQGGSEPEASAKVARHFSNLLEAPTLFYAACLAAMLVGPPTALVVGLAWAYVAVRAVHTWIHTGSNTVPYRLGAYLASWLVLVLLWGSVVYRAATGGA